MARDPRRTRLSLTLSCAVGLLSGPALGQEASSSLVRLLESGRLPEERQATVIELIGRRGGAAELGYLYRRATADDGFSPAIRRKALDALADAAAIRQARPDGDLSGIRTLLKNPATRLAAARLIGLWKLDAALDDLSGLAAAGDDAARRAAFDALATLGTTPARTAIEALTRPDQPGRVRALAVAALARFDLDAAAKLAADAVQNAPPDADLAPLVAAFVSRQDGPDKLAAALAGAAIPADAAKIALRALYSLGRSDPALVAVLSKAAGLDAEVQPLDKEEMDRLSAEIAEQGDPQRGEAVFRRAELNCARCHALLGAGGGIGPDLSSIGQSSPVDYIVNSLLLPDQAIKEEFHTLVVLTTEGQVFQGIVADRDANRIVLKEATGELRTVPMAHVEETKEGGSLMPKGLTNLITRQELVDLVRFLSELGKPGPYALRSVPTIQRWRVLRPLPDALRGDVPRVEGIRTEILESTTAQWVPAYALFSGSLPLGEILVGNEGSTLLYLQGELDVAVGGPVEFRLDSPAGVHAWLNDRDLGAGPRFTANLIPGRARLTLRIDTAQRTSPLLRVEVAKPPRSPASFTVVGGP